MKVVKVETMMSNSKSRSGVGWIILSINYNHVITCDMSESGQIKSTKILRQKIVCVKWREDESRVDNICEDNIRMSDQSIDSMRAEWIIYLGDR